METTSTSDSTAHPTTAATEELSPLEQDVLDEYERLAANMKKVPNPLPPAQKNPSPTAIPPLSPAPDKSG